MSEMDVLLDEKPPLDSPKGRRLIWLGKELKDWLLDETQHHYSAMDEPHKAITRMLWAQIDKQMSGWGG